MSAAPLPQLLDTALCRLWPNRTQQELLLDLGEHKAWGPTDRAAAVQRLADWLQTELGLPASFAPSDPCPADVMRLPRLRALGTALARDPGSGGIARWIAALAPALGGSPKTVANRLSAGPAAHHAVTRWAAVIERVAVGGGAPDAWLYHRRTQAAVLLELSATFGRAVPDAGDALLLSSLVSLWQRRRQSAEARASRGREVPRRGLAKPIARLGPGLIQPGQIAPMVALAGAFELGSALLSLVLEATLTEAHVRPHPGRGQAPVESGEDLLRVVERVLDDSGHLLEETQVQVFRFRIARMRAWRDQIRMLDIPSVRTPYVEASLLLERRHQDPTVALAPVAAHGEGVFMLWPQLRQRGLLEGE